MDNIEKPLIYISYSHKDEKEKKELVEYLMLLEEVDIRSDNSIKAGSQWKQAINNTLEGVEKASAVIFLITPNFLASDLILKEEVPYFLKRKQELNLIIFPILAKPCAWENIDWLSDLNIHPPNALPVWREGGKFADRELKIITLKIWGALDNTENGTSTKKQILGDLDQKILGDLDRKTLEEMDSVDNTIHDQGRPILDAEGREILDAEGNPISDSGSGTKFDQSASTVSDENSEPISNEHTNVSIEGQALSDAYSQIDLLGYSDYVEALANFITSPKTKKPITIGIDAAWGGGKTTLMRLLEKRLSPSKEKGKAHKHINTVWFDAWKYDQQEMLWAAMVLEILEQVRKQFSVKQKTGWFFRLNSKRFDWGTFFLSLFKTILIAFVLSALGFGAFSLLVSLLGKTWADTLEWLKDYTKVLAALGLVSLLYTIFKDVLKLIVFPFNLGISQYAKKPNYKERIGFLNKFTEDFKYIISSITQKGEWPLVVFIDDLDRCSPTKSAEVIEAMNLLLDSEHCVFILGVDTAMLSRSIQAKYKNIQPFFEDSEYTSRLGLGRHFLEKIIQIDFHIPRPAPKHFSNFIDAQLGQTTSVEKKTTDKEQSEAENLIQAKQRSGKTTEKAKEEVVKERPDLEDVINDAVEAVEERTFENDPEVIKAIKDMTPYLNYNPRRIKRFINIFRLQALIAHRRGLLETRISFDNLARWIVINMRWPEFIGIAVNNHELALSIRRDTGYINELPKNEKISYIETIKLEEKYPLVVYRFLSDPKFSNILKMSGQWGEMKNYLSLASLFTPTNNE